MGRMRKPADRDESKAAAHGVIELEAADRVLRPTLEGHASRCDVSPRPLSALPVVEAASLSWDAPSHPSVELTVSYDVVSCAERR